MARKREITGKVVIYTKNGTRIIDAEVRCYYNAQGEYSQSRFDCDEDYLLVAQARTIPTDDKYAAACCPEAIDAAEKYTRTKFFRLMLDLMRLAQFNPIDKRNYILLRHEFDNISINKKFPSTCKRFDWQEVQFDWSADVDELDEQLYRHFGFTPEMIHFAEENYHDAR